MPPLMYSFILMLCGKMDGEHSVLLFHSNICWLSQGKLLEILASLCNEIDVFLEEQNHKLANRFSDKWIVHLLFLSDCFSHLDQLNTTMNGRNKIFLDVSEDIVSFTAKI